MLHLIPAAPCRILDVGAGTGRDAAWLAGMGHRVTAVEPTEAMRLRAIKLHPSPLIEWLDDSLPELARVRSGGELFDLILLSAVWMHFDLAQRREAMASARRAAANRRHADPPGAARSGAGRTAHVRNPGSRRPSNWPARTACKPC